MRATTPAKVTSLPGSVFLPMKAPRARKKQKPSMAKSITANVCAAGMMTSFQYFVCLPAVLGQILHLFEFYFIPP
jgi:hypothetical protein